MQHLPGTPVRCEMSKWGGGPHWEFDGVFLGTDDHGDWLGFPAGTHHSRPGRAFDSEVDTVTLVPLGGWSLPTFHAPGIWCDLYVDVATPAEWTGDVLRAIDLDLDVIRMSNDSPVRRPPPGVLAGPGVAFVDDEDEFAEHQVSFGYPAEVITAARSAANEVFAAVMAGTAPYDGSHRRWLEQLAALPR